MDNNGDRHGRMAGACEFLETLCDLEAPRDEPEK